MKKVFISTSTFGEYDDTPVRLIQDQGMEVQKNPFGRKLEVSESLDILKDVDYLIAGTEILNQEVLEKASNLQIISRCGVGMDGIDMEAAKARGIEIYNTPDTLTSAVAELALGLMINLLRQISASDRNTKKGDWQKIMGQLLGGKKVGIVGFGRIGQKLSQLLGPFGVEIGYSDIQDASGDSTAQKMELNALLAWADIVSIHCSKDPARTDYLIGEHELGLMKKGAWLVNVSRGGIIDENALAAALKDNKLSGAALDVFEQEPYNGPLTKLDNVILTPHIGSYAKEARITTEMEAVKNLINGINQRK